MGNLNLIIYGLIYEKELFKIYIYIDIVINYEVEGGRVVLVTHIISQT